jgi:hypothetical protein
MMAKVRRRSTSAASGVAGIESAGLSGLFMHAHVAGKGPGIKGWRQHRGHPRTDGTQSIQGWK